MSFVVFFFKHLIQMSQETEEFCADNQKIITKTCYSINGKERETSKYRTEMVKIKDTQS